MKKILGSLLLLSLTLYAKSAYEWKIQLEQQELYLHQATVLSMQCTFSKEGKNDDVEFIPPADTAFEFKRLSQEKHFSEEIQTISYKYLLFARKAGEQALHLKPKMLFTTQSAIDNVIIGRDNINDLEVEKEIARLEPITIKVEQTDSYITGRLALKTDLDKKAVSAYEPVHLEIVYEGEGNLQDLKPISFEIEGAQVFSDEPETQFVLDEKGYKGKWIQRFAFVGKKDFTIPVIELRYFDLQDAQQKALLTEAFSIRVKDDGISREQLIDKVDLPSDKIDMKKYYDYLYYLLTFIAGFIAAKLIKIPARTPKKEKGTKIKKAKDAKELLEILIVCEKNLFSKEIEDLENIVYKGGKTDLSAVKKRAISKL